MGEVVIFNKPGRPFAPRATDAQEITRGDLERMAKLHGCTVMPIEDVKRVACILDRQDQRIKALTDMVATQACFRPQNTSWCGSMRSLFRYALNAFVYFCVGLAIFTCLLVGWALVTAPAHAAPPKPGSEDYDDLVPYSEWINAQKTNEGGSCCTVDTDCRVVAKWKIEGGAYWAFIEERDKRGFVKFPGGPNTWMLVPSGVVKVENTPTSMAVACWSSYKGTSNGFYCFFLPNLT